MFNRTRRSLSIAAGTALLAACAVLTGTAPTIAAPAGTEAGVQDGTGTAAAPQPRGSFGAPVNVHVSTNEFGMYVYATPICSGWKSCRSWFTIPGFVDKKDVATTNGYFVAWPAGWQEGQSVSSGYVRSYGRDIFGNGWYGTATASMGTITRPFAPRTLTAWLTGQNDQSRTASVSGTATPGAEIKRNGVLVARADQRGSWNATVGGLTIGTTTLSFDQYVDQGFHDRASVTVTIAGEIVSATVTGPASVNPGTVNTVTGTATPGATYEVVDASGTVIVPGGPFTVDGAGKWSFPHLVPAGSTEFRFAIRQTAWGKTVTSELFTLPADTMRDVTVATEHVRDGVSNRFSGKGTPGATYRVLNVSDNEIVTGGPFSIDREGRWEFDRVVSRGVKEFRFKLEQRKDGQTVRSQLFTIPAE